MGALDEPRSADRKHDKPVRGGGRRGFEWTFLSARADAGNGHSNRERCARVCGTAEAFVIAFAEQPGVGGEGELSFHRDQPAGCGDRSDSRSYRGGEKSCAATFHEITS